MTAATLTIDLEKIASNAQRIAARAAASGVDLYGVTKAVAGMPQIARAMLAGGFAGLGESRLENVRRLRRDGISAPVMMLRIPPLSEADQVVQLTNVSLNSELGTLRALSAAAVRTDRLHDVILMAELGDLREGMSPGDLLAASDVAMELPGVRLIGIGSNLLCASGVIPTAAKMQELSDLAEAVEARHGIRLSNISGGNSSCLSLLASGTLPPRINGLRIGYGVLLGRDGVDGTPLPDMHQDTFTIEGELIEKKRKASLPSGDVGRDAFGNVPVFKDRGERLRGIVSLGRLDLDPRSLFPKAENVEVVTASSDHLILDLTDAPPMEIGDCLDFILEYPSLVQAIMSPYVAKRLAGQTAPARPQGTRLVASAPMLGLIRKAGLLSELADLGLTAEEVAAADAGGIRDAVGAAVRAGRVPVHFSGNRQPAADTLKGLATGSTPFGLLWFDARTGCDPVGEDPEVCVLRRLLEADDARPVANAETTALVGLRRASLDAVRFIRALDLRAFTMEDVDEFGVREVTRRALVAATYGTRGVVLVMHVSFADNGFGLGATHAGLNYRECSQAMEMIAASGALHAVVLTGVPEDAAPEALGDYLEYLLSAFGRRILGGFAAESDALLR